MDRYPFNVMNKQRPEVGDFAAGADRPAVVKKQLTADGPNTGPLGS